MNKYFVIDKDRHTIRAAGESLSGACKYWKNGRAIFVSSPDNIYWHIHKFSADDNWQVALELTDYLLSCNVILNSAR